MGNSKLHALLYDINDTWSVWNLHTIFILNSDLLAAKGLNKQQQQTNKQTNKQKRENYTVKCNMLMVDAVLWESHGLVLDVKRTCTIIKFSLFIQSFTVNCYVLAEVKKANNSTHTVDR